MAGKRKYRCLDCGSTQDCAHVIWPKKRFKPSYVFTPQPCVNPDLAEIMEILIKNGANLEQKDDKNETPLIAAVKSGNFTAAQTLIRAGANLKHSPQGSESPLSVAVKNRDINIARLLISSGANPAPQLLNAATDQSLQQVKFLVIAGADLQTELPGGLNLLHLASSTGFKKLVSLLLSFGSPVNKTSKKFKETPLHFAAEEGHIKVVKLLLSAGADMNVKDIRGWTPLRWAFSKGHNDIAECLRKAGGVL